MESILWHHSLTSSICLSMLWSFELKSVDNTDLIKKLKWLWMCAFYYSTQMSQKLIFFKNLIKLWHSLGKAITLSSVKLAEKQKWNQKWNQNISTWFLEADLSKQVLNIILSKMHFCELQPVGFPCPPTQLSSVVAWISSNNINTHPHLRTSTMLKHAT